MKHNRKHLGKETGYYKTVKNAVYENDRDKELGKPPLFCWEVEISDIDLKRIDISKMNATVKYETRKPTPQP